MKKILLVLPVLIFTAQACNLFSLTPQEGSGSRGVFKSTDRGQTWEEVNEIGSDKSMAAGLVLRVVAEPENTKNVLAASANMGLLASENKADSWIELFPAFSARDTLFNPLNAKEIYLAGGDRGFAKILKTLDRGGTWIEIFSEPQADSAVVRLLANPLNGSILYGALSSGALIKSSDGGSTWNKILETTRPIADISVGRDDIYALHRTGPMSYSGDGGASWEERKMPTRTSDGRNVVAIDPSASSNVYVGTEAGLFRSRDRGVNWEKIQLPASAKVDNVTAIALNPRNSREIFAAVRSIVYRSEDLGITWQTVALDTQRTIADLEIDPQEPNIIYAGLR